MLRLDGMFQHIGHVTGVEVHCIELASDYSKLPQSNLKKWVTTFLSAALLEQNLQCTEAADPDSHTASPIAHKMESVGACSRVNMKPPSESASKARIF